jgi:hypothetical protein
MFRPKARKAGYSAGMSQEDQDALHAEYAAMSRKDWGAVLGKARKLEIFPQREKALQAAGLLGQDAQT